MEHLALEIFDLPTASVPKPTTSKFAMLPEGTSITINDSSEIFGSGDVWSYNFTLNTRANSHIFGTSGEIHGSRLHEQINKRRARLWVEGEPMFLGYLKLDDEVEVDTDGNVDVSFESGQKTFDQLIEGAKANQVPLMGDVMYGVALWRKRWTYLRLHLTAALEFENNKVSTSVPLEYASGGRAITFETDGDSEKTPQQEYPRMVFPKGEFKNYDTGEIEEFDCINTDYPYDDEHPYCNVALCYQRTGYEKKNEKGELVPDYSSEPEAQRGYEVMPANRVNSAPNFYVIYWIRCLMKHLGIYIDENQMMDVQDLRRLFFANTNCAYRVPKELRSNSQYDKRFNRFVFSDGKRRVPEHFGDLYDTEIGGYDAQIYDGIEKLIKKEESGFTVKDGWQMSEASYNKTDLQPETISRIDREIAALKLKKININISDIFGMSEIIRETYEEKNGFLHEAYATSECFPDEDISNVIDALESGFGIRFIFDDNYQRVRIVLLRKVFRDKEIQDISCDILGDAKKENSIRGFRMTYGESTDTAFYYKGFSDLMPHKQELWPDTSDTHDYSQWELDAKYSEVLHKVSAFNKTCFVTPSTGNAYGIKVDKDAKRYEELHPSLFEYAGYMDAEDGDCTGEDDTIETINVGFTPAIMNDLNFENERSGVKEQKFALFVGETMRPRRPDLLEEGVDYNDPTAFYDVDGKLYGKEKDSDEYTYGNMMSEDGIVKPGEFAITSDMFAGVNNLKARVTHYIRLGEWYDGEGGSSGDFGISVFWDVTNINLDGHINEGYRLYLQDNFEPNDDGIAPVETHKWGLTLGIMRGSGSDAYVKYEADPDDLEGNDTWEKQAGSSITAHPDTCDNYGNLWDYNGVEPGPGDLEDRVSLKLRAEKLNPYYDKTKPDEGKIINTKSEAGETMTEMFTSANVDLLSRPKVSASTMRAAGWDVTDSYATVCGQIYSVTFGRGESTITHDILWTPIRPNGTVLTEEELKTYISRFSGRPNNSLYSLDIEHLILDLDTTKRRRSLLNGLQAIYYADDVEQVTPVTLPSDNPRYLPIDNEDLQGRGLADQFYKEYSFWVRNARIVTRKLRMELAQLRAIDKTKRVRVGDITGFIKKMQYTVNNKTGLGLVTMEIMYI